jgi:class 3 adenylate cyclase/predicted ATPase
VPLPGRPQKRRLASTLTGSVEFHPVHVIFSSVMSVFRAWLDQHGVGKYAELFAENDIGLDVLPDLTDADLEKLGVSLGDRRRILKAAASREISAIASAPAATPRADTREAERRQLTVMFCDLVGSTELSTKLDAEDFRDVIKAFQDACTEVVARSDGHVAKSLGDGLLVYFGYPLAHEDDAARAVHAGLGIVEAVTALEPRPGVFLATRIGIATGPVVAGDLVGERISDERAVLGDIPNLAARLQGAAEPNCVMVSDTTRRLTGAMFAYSDLGHRRLKGIAEPVPLCRAVSERALESRFEAHHELLTEFVGRQHEFGLLLDRWERAKGREGQVVLLSGEAGIGKSRIAHMLHRRLEGEPYLDLRYQCSPRHTNSALHPVIRQLELAASFMPDDTAEQRLDKLEALLGQSNGDIVEAMPLFAALLSVPIGDRYPVLDATPQQQMEKTLTALTERLVGLSAKETVLLLFEDAHWIDPTTEELMELIVERVRDLPVLVVMTYRPDFSPPWQTDSHVTALTLNRLTSRQSAAMVAAVTSGRALPAQVLDRIVAKSDGVPLFVEELTRSVLEADFLTEGADGYVLTASLPELAIPATVQDALTARLDRLETAKETAQIGAAIGREFSHELMAAVTPLPETELQAALDRLFQSGLIFRRGSPPNPTYIFKHALVRDAAYHSLLRSKCQQTHRKIAQALEGRFPQAAETQPELVAHHFTEAGLADQAVSYWYRAGRRAAGRSANREAVGHLTKGLDVLQKTSDTPDRRRQELALRMALGPPLQAVKGQAAQETAEAFRRARELCEQLGEVTQLSTALHGLHACHIVRGELRPAMDLAEECYRIARHEEDGALLAAALFELGCVEFHFAKLTSAREHFEKAVQYHDPSPSAPSVLPAGVDLGVFAKCYLSHVVWFLGYPQRAVELSRAAASDAAGSAHVFSEALAAAYTAMLMQFLGDASAAKQQAEAAIALCREHKFPYYLAWARMIRGWALARERQEGEGIMEMREGLAALLATDAGLRRPYYLGILAETLGAAGQIDEACDLAASAFAAAAEHGEQFFSAELHRIEGELLAARSEPEASESAFSRALAIARAQKARAIELRAATGLARLWHDLGRTEEARDLLPPVYGWFTEGFDRLDMKNAKALLDKLA